MNNLLSSLPLAWRMILLNGISLITVGALLVGMSMYMSKESQQTVEQKTMSLLSEQAEQQVSMAVNNVAGKLQHRFDEAYQQVNAINRAIVTLESQENEQLRRQVVELLQASLRDNRDAIGIWSFWETNAVDGRDAQYIDNMQAGSNENGRFAYAVYYEDESSNRITESSTPEFVIKSYYENSVEEYNSYNCAIRALKGCIVGPDELTIDIDFENSITTNISTISAPIVKNGRLLGNTGIDIPIDYLNNFLEETNRKLYDGAGKMAVIGSFNKIAGSSSQDYTTGKKINQLVPELSKWIDSSNRSGKFAIRLDEKTDAYQVVFPFEAIPGTESWSILYYIPKAKVLDAAYALDQELSAGVQKNTTIQVATFLIITVLGLIWISFSAKNIVSPVLDITGMLKEIAHGDADLTKELSVKGKDELAELASWFNQFLQQLRQLVLQIAETTHSLDDNAEKNSVVVQHTGEEISRQLLEINNIATAISEMAATAQEVARSASETAEQAQGANKTSMNGLQNVQETTEHVNQLTNELNTTVNVINKLADQSSHISNIIKIISDIAEQTNLLALNAAIESARAGEHGRGFAVVADEVRSLAQRTQESTHQIQSMIEEFVTGTKQAAEIVSSNQHKAQQITALASGAGDAINEMTDTVSRISDMSLQIATAIEQQSAVTEEINRNIVAISDTTKGIESGSKEISNSSQTVSSLASSLGSLVNKFKAG